MSVWPRTSIIVILVTSLPLSGYLFLVSCIHLYKSGSRYLASKTGTSTPTSSLVGGSSKDALIPMVIATAQVLGSVSNFVNQSLFLVQAVVPASHLPIGGCPTWIWVADIAYLTFQPCATLVIIHRATAVISPKSTVWYKRRATAQMAFSVVFLTGFLLVALSVFMRRIWTDTTTDTCGAEYVLTLNSAGKMIFFALYMSLALTFALPLLSHLRKTSVIRESKAKLPSRSVSATAKTPSPLAQSADKQACDKMMSTDHRGDVDEYKVGATSSNNGRRSMQLAGTYQVTSLPSDYAPNRGFPSPLPLPGSAGSAGGGSPTTPAPSPAPNRPIAKLRPATRSPSANTLNAKESTEDKLRRLLHDVTFRIMIAVLAYLATATAALFGGFSNAYSVQFTLENHAALYAATLSSGKRYRKRPSSNLSLASVAPTPRAVTLPVTADKMRRSVSATSNRAAAAVAGAVGRKLLGKLSVTGPRPAKGSPIAQVGAGATVQTVEMSPSEACFQSPGVSHDCASSPSAGVNGPVAANSSSGGGGGSGGKTSDRSHQGSDQTE